MEVQFDPEFRAEILNRIRTKYKFTEQRSEIHLSDLIYCITKAYWKKTVGIPVSDEEVLLWAIGLGLEEVLLEDGTNRNRPEPVVLNGIVLSPDHISGEALAELKSTRMQFSKGALEPSRGWPEGWIKQMKGYQLAAVVGVIPGAEADYYKLAVLQVIGAGLEARRFYFSQEELDELWAWVEKRRDVLKKALEVKRPPEPFAFTDSGRQDDWQCKNCSMQLMCIGALQLGEFVSEQKE